jgi:hypothetical protein
MTEFVALCARLAGNELGAGECENLTGEAGADGVAFPGGARLPRRLRAHRYAPDRPGGNPS